MLLIIAIIGFLSILFVAGGIWAVQEGAPIIGAILLCLIVGAIVIAMTIL